MSITQKERRFPSATGLCDIVYRQWIPEEIRGAVVLVHDKAEHIARYDVFSKYLAENGFMVAGLDIPSHGKSWKEGLPRGFFGTEDGWGKILSDIRTLCATVRRENPQVSVTLFGNALGSMLSQDYISRYTNDFDAAILCGTPSLDHMAYFRRFLCNREIKAGRGMVPSPKLEALFFGNFSRRIPNSKTAFDWLSFDEENVNAYVSDPLCGFAFTPYGYASILGALGQISNAKWAAKVPDIPVLVLSGDMDPVGNMGKGAKKAARCLESSGHTCVTCKLYAGARHEILHESCRQEVYEDVLLFLEAVAAGGERE